jgi:hypothetical protein
MKKYAVRNRYGRIWALFDSIDRAIDMAEQFIGATVDANPAPAEVRRFELCR